MEVRKYLTASLENLVWLNLGATEFPSGTQWQDKTQESI